MQNQIKDHNLLLSKDRDGRQQRKAWVLLVLVLEEREYGTVQGKIQRTYLNAGKGSRRSAIKGLQNVGSI
jgi:hypothetical protein